MSALSDAAHALWKILPPGPIEHQLRDRAKIEDALQQFAELEHLQHEDARAIFHDVYQMLEDRAGVKWTGSQLAVEFAKQFRTILKELQEKP